MTYALIYLIGALVAWICGVIGLALRRHGTRHPWADVLYAGVVALLWPLGMLWAYIKMHARVGL